ncbi:MAG: L-threonylcarbamoyladenylate synthase [Methylophilaceae bacterium]
MLITLTEAVHKLQAGELVAIPTETVYGLAGDATNEAALRKIYALKQRPLDNPLIVHIADISQVQHWAAEFPPLAETLARAFWPGALTLVLPAQPQVSSIVRGGQSTVALRVPSHPLALQILKLSGLALAAPSANQFTQLSPTTAAHVRAGLGDELAVLDGGACAIGIESTIVQVAGDNWRVLRQGMISEAAIAEIAAIAAIAAKPALTTLQAVKAPGQHHVHYSPQTPLHLYATRLALLAESQRLAAQNSPHAALLFGAGELPLCQNIVLADEANQAAHALYSALHQLDALNCKQLLVELPPNTPTWLAILDKLRRAAQG